MKTCTLFQIHTWKIKLFPTQSVPPPGLLPYRLMLESSNEEIKWWNKQLIQWRMRTREETRTATVSDFLWRRANQTKAEPQIKWRMVCKSGETQMIIPTHLKLVKAYRCLSQTYTLEYVLALTTTTEIIDRCLNYWIKGSGRPNANSCKNQNLWTLRFKPTDTRRNVFGNNWQILTDI